MAQRLLGDEDFLMDEASVLALFADLDAANGDSTATCSPAKERPLTKMSWRQRRKEEILSLRAVIEQLTVELERLKLAAGVHSTLPGSKKAFAAVSSSAPTLVLKAHAAHKTEASMMWEMFAGHQSGLRTRSEQENAKLREAVTLYLHQAKLLQSTIKRKVRENTTASSMDLIRQHRLNTRGVTPPLNNKAVFDQLRSGLDEALGDVNHFFELVGMNELPCPGRRNDTMKGRAKGAFMEFLDSYAVPFDLEQTGKTIWALGQDKADDDRLLFKEVRLRRGYVDDGSKTLKLYCSSFAQNFTTESNTRMNSTCHAYSFEGISFRIVMRSVTRKFVEKDQAVFISRTLIEPIISDCSTHSFVETNRTSVTRAQLSSVGPVTVMRTHRVATMLHRTSTTEILNPDIGLETWESNITRFHNQVEDQLMRAAIRKAEK
jgi:hypothetical protein